VRLRSLEGVADLPLGVYDEQAPGAYRLHRLIESRHNRIANRFHNSPPCDHRTDFGTQHFDGGFLYDGRPARDEAHGLRAHDF